MIKLSVDALTGFSTAPLKMATFAGVGGALVALLLMVYTIVGQARGMTIPGWTSRPSQSSLGRCGAGFVLAFLASISVACTHTCQGRPTYYVAYDSLMTVLHDAGPTDTPRP